MKKEIRLNNTGQMPLDEWEAAGKPVCWTALEVPSPYEVDIDTAYGRMRLVNTETLSEDLGKSFCQVDDAVLLAEEYGYSKPTLFKHLA